MITELFKGFTIEVHIETAFEQEARIMAKQRRLRNGRYAKKHPAWLNAIINLLTWEVC